MRITRPWYRTAQTISGFEEPPVIAPTVESPSVEVAPAVAQAEVTPPNVEEEELTPDTSGLKSALQKERADRKALAKKLAAYEKSEQDRTDAEKTEIQRLIDQDQRKTAKLQQLAEGFRKSKIEAAVIKAARAEGFTDPTDAIRQEVLMAIGVEQDEDDPSQVTIDETSLKKAIQDLAKAKPHYKAAAQQKPPPSGSKFGGSSTPPAQTEQQKLAALYPALARRG